ncbi:hypothetical protein A3E99_01345 [Candidatus Kaiserbacteria bacterium RIFCSPHIGHO2_12_FULL_54_16]|nr:MAG: hypothetical protein A3E99_01345 [Candidatus Kaiserbacteria bacterium RIFCSPHIGHO2_12_FULL_54_16]OGG90822.1 MAG: hypothetical protein A3G12_03070 [Candidatus Kaiserbacteria bacterium RIFCSPLOWO2_12_FULL_54_10]
MKKIIARAAFFTLCTECRCHGHVICADGTTSNEFATISGGLKELTDLVLAEKVAEDEMLEVKRQIKESGLDCEAPDVDEILARRSKIEGGIKSILDEFHQEINASVHVAETKRNRGIIHVKRTLH